MDEDTKGRKRENFPYLFTLSILMRIKTELRIYSIGKTENIQITFSADSSYCWAFSISSMLRHSLNMFLRERKKKGTHDQEKISQAEQYLNSKKFHKILRNGFETQKNRVPFSLIFVNFSFFF